MAGSINTIYRGLIRKKKKQKKTGNFSVLNSHSSFADSLFGNSPTYLNLEVAPKSMLLALSHSFMDTCKQWTTWVTQQTRSQVESN